MTKGEIDILTAIVLNKCTPKQIASSRVARSSSFISMTIDSLLEQGYILKDKYRGYRLTQKGASAFMEFNPNREALNRVAHNKLAHEHGDKAREAINMIERLGIKYLLQVEGFLN
jgi:Mn-dependent DtxR family transcriptional regulator